eukprot:scaffold877_cov154-Amphora_coffeaeformis.AAC.4
MMQSEDGAKWQITSWLRIEIENLTPRILISSYDNEQIPGTLSRSSMVVGLVGVGSCLNDCIDGRNTYGFACREKRFVVAYI